MQSDSPLWPAQAQAHGDSRKKLLTDKNYGFSPSRWDMVLECWFGEVGDKTRRLMGMVRAVPRSWNLLRLKPRPRADPEALTSLNVWQN